jgi:hypothetical protein
MAIALPTTTGAAAANKVRGREAKIHALKALVEAGADIKIL